MWDLGGDNVNMHHALISFLEGGFTGWSDHVPESL